MKPCLKDLTQMRNGKQNETYQKSHGRSMQEQRTQETTHGTYLDISYHTPQQLFRKNNKVNRQPFKSHIIHKILYNLIL